MLLGYFLIVLWILGFAGWGFGLARVLTNLKRLNWGDAILFGMCPVWILTTLWNFIFPVGSYFPVLILLGGMALLVVHRREWNQNSGENRLRGIILGSLIFVLGWHAINAEPFLDVGLYHLPAILWTQKMALSPGLGHLNPYIAYNNANLILGAAMSLPLTGWIGAFILVAITVIATVMSLMERVLFSQDRALKFSTYVAFWMVFSLLIFRHLLLPVAFTPTDVPSTVLGAYVFFYLVKSWETKDTTEIPLAIAIALLATLIKSSSFIFLLGALCTWVWLKGSPRSKKFSFSTQDWRTLGLLLLMGVPWVIRLYWMTGCWAYPLSFSCFPSQTWSISPLTVRALTRHLKAYAIDPFRPIDDVLSNWSWIGPHLGRMIDAPLSQVFMVVIFLALIGLSSRKLLYKAPKHPRRLFWLGFLLCMGGVVFCFAFAPDIRYMAGYWLCLSSIMAAQGFYFSPLKEKLWERRHWIFLLIAVFLGGRVFKQVIFGPYVWTHWPSLPLVGLEEKTTQSGESIFIPNFRSRCWDSHLYCAPEFDPKKIDRKQISEYRVMFFEPQKN